MIDETHFFGSEVRRWTLSLLAGSMLVFATIGCGNEAAERFEDDSRFEPTSLQSQDDAESWLGWSAPNALFLSMLAPAFDHADTEEDDCPIYEDNGDEIVVSGGCTDDDGRTWRGSVTLVDSFGDLGVAFPFAAPEEETEGDGGVALALLNGTYEDFGYTVTETCPTDETVQREVDRQYSGTIDVTEVGDDQYEFDVDVEWTGTELDEETCEVGDEALMIVYGGEFEVHDIDGENRAVVHEWNGLGAVGSAKEGWAELETEDQRFNIGSCDSQPLEGSTFARSDGTEMELRYDGAGDCDTEADAGWYLDGEKQGELTGAHCSSTGGSTGVVAVVLMLIALFGVRRCTGMVTRG